MSVVGFDFGNSKCVVAVARRRGIDVLQNEVGNRATPSVVAFSGKSRLLGTEALSQQMSNPKNTVNNLKRLIGRRLDDPTLKDEVFNYKLVPSKHNPDYIATEVQYDDKSEVFSPEQLTGALFQKLKGTAEAGLEGTKVTDCVISCPPWWNDTQRRALLDGANIAGLNVLRLMNETSAIGLNYGILNSRLPKDKESRVLFVDMGHSGTNCAVIAFTEGKLQVLGTASDAKLGGRDFDDMLVHHFTKMILEKYKMDVTKDIKAMLKLRKECERVKLHLSANTKVQFSVEYIMNDRDVSGSIDRAEFEALAAQSILPRLNNLISGLLTKLNVNSADLYAIEVVGGAVRIPSVQRSLTEFFKRDLSKTCDGDESVARGCALMCAMISPSFKVKEFEVHDASPYPIALEWGAVTQGPMKPDDTTSLFSPFNPIPSVKLISFADRAEPFQIVARYSAVDSLPSGTDPVLGKFIVSGMPKVEKPGKIKVRVKLNLHGIISVTSAQLLEEIEEEQKPDVPMTDAASPPPAASPTGEDKMDTSEAGTEPTKEAKEAAAAAAAATKRKVNKIDLSVEAHYTGGLTSAVLTQYFEREAAMAHQDRVIFETLQAKNDLESYVLDMRNRLDNDLAHFATDSEKQTLQTACTVAEDWLYSDGYDAQKSEYKNRLAELRKLGDPIVFRKYEAETRGDHAAALQKAVADLQQWASSSDEKYSHITPEDKAKVHSEAQSAHEWLLAALPQVERAPKHENPSLTSSQIKARREALEKLAHPIINKPKPAPKPVEKPAEPKQEQKEQTPPEASSSPAPEAAATEPMDTSASA